jgi:hypothetical protein
MFFFFIKINYTTNFFLINKHNTVAAKVERKLKKNAYYNGIIDILTYQIFIVIF